MPIPEPLAAVVVTGGLFGFIFFMTRWVQMKSGYRALSRAEQHKVNIVAAREAAARVTLHDKIRTKTRELGLGESLFPFYVAALIAYLVMAVPLTAIGVPLLPGLLVAGPLSAAVAYTVVAMQARKNRTQVNRQLRDLIQAVQGHLASGVGTERALNLLLPQTPAPLHKELKETLTVSQSGRDLVAAFRTMEEKYPSALMTQWISALEIDQQAGQSIVQALEAAIDMHRKNEALAREVDAELSASKGEVNAIAGLMTALSVYVALGNREQAVAAFSQPLGAVALFVAACCTVGGFLLTHRIIAKLQGDH